MLVLVWNSVEKVVFWRGVLLESYSTKGWETRGDMPMLNMVSAMIEKFLVVVKKDAR